MEKEQIQKQYKNKIPYVQVKLKEAAKLKMELKVLLLSYIVYSNADEC